MRVLMVIPSFKPLVGGAERQLEGLVENLSGIKVLIVTRQLYGTKKNEKIDKYDIVRLSAMIPRFSFSIMLFLFLIKERKNFDVIHCHTLNGPAIISTIIGRIIKKPVILKVTRTGEGSQLNSYKKTKLKRLLFYILAKCSSKFIAITKDVKISLIELGIEKKKIESIPNGVNLKNFLKEKNSETIQVIFIGRLIPRKRANWVIKSYAGLKMIKNTKLTIIGDGEEFNTLKCLIDKLNIKEHVFLKGQLSKDHVEKELVSAKIFILPSTSEGMSNALLEAMANGLAVIATDIEQNRELISDRINGRLFKTQEELALILNELVLDKEQRIRLGTNAHLLMQQKFSFSIVANKYEKLYNRLKYDL
jgi:glycosyltransferase involved in cell wall biosynthesis